MSESAYYDDLARWLAAGVRRQELDESDYRRLPLRRFATLLRSLPHRSGARRYPVSHFLYPAAGPW
jgi:hypothetical protein